MADTRARPRDDGWARRARGVHRRSLPSGALLLAAGVLCCASSPRETPRAAQADPLEPLPRSYAECVAEGGEVEPQERGGRCYRYYSPRWDVSAYTRCRNANGVPRLVGPGRRVDGQSHVCTLVFAPDD